MEKALQDICRPEGVCYGCGPSNPLGLQIKSYWDVDDKHVRAAILPDEAFTGPLGGVSDGFLAMLVDCHSNWTVMAYHYRVEDRAPDSLPQVNCVTGKLGVRYLESAPIGVPLDLCAWIEGDVGRKTRVICEIRSGDKLVAVGDSIFVRTDAKKLADQAHQGVGA